ncbi:MAG TPA: hypothetical protein VNK04_15870 [Gemmataceae bacterium]|nr:hypothetical protein [Gemmataceae bacterium]
MLPLQFNDGKPVPRKWIGKAVREIAERFGGASYETQKIEGHWYQTGVYYRDTLVRITVDVPDTVENRRWMKEFKARWKTTLEQLELWMVSYRIDVE